jgi:hypothetical protein
VSRNIAHPVQLAVWKNPVAYKILMLYNPQQIGPKLEVNMTPDIGS